MGYFFGITKFLDEDYFSGLLILAVGTMHPRKIILKANILLKKTSNTIKK